MIKRRFPTLRPDGNDTKMATTTATIDMNFFIFDGFN